MKNLRLMLLALIGVIAANSLSSCNDDDDNKIENNVRTLTEAEKTQYKQVVNGDYTGYVIYQHPDSVRPDSFPVNWKVDMISSTMTVENFPYQLLKGVAQPEKEVLEAAGNQTLRAEVTPFVADYEQYINEGVCRYQVIPSNKKMIFKANDKDITIDFATSISNGYYRYDAIGVYYNGEFSCNIIFDQLTVGYTIYAVNQMAVMIGKKVTY